MSQTRTKQFDMLKHKIRMLSDTFPELSMLIFFLLGSWCFKLFIFKMNIWLNSMILKVFSNLNDSNLE